MANFPAGLRKTRKSASHGPNSRLYARAPGVGRGSDRGDRTDPRALHAFDRGGQSSSSSSSPEPVNTIAVTTAA